MQVPELPKDLKELTPLLLKHNAEMILGMMQQFGKRDTDHEKIYCNAILELVNYVKMLVDWQTRPIYNSINKEDIRSNQWIYFEYNDGVHHSFVIGRTFSTEDKSIPNNIACCGFEHENVGDSFVSHIPFPNDKINKVKLLTIN